MLGSSLTGRVTAPDEQGDAMNWYYVRDGERAGPVTEGELRDLHTQGTITAATLVWREGLDAWKPFTEMFPGAAAPGTGPPPPPQAPGPPAGPGIPSFPESGVRGDPAALAAVEYEVNIGECFSRAWAMFTGPKFGILFGAGALTYVIYIGAANLPVVGIFAGLFSWALFAGLYQFYLRHIRGGPEPPFELLFSGFKFQLGALVLISLIEFAAFIICMLPALGALLVAAVSEEDAILIAAGVFAVLGLIPWIYLYVSWGFAPILCLDKGLGPWTALETSRRVVQKRWLSVFLLLVVTGLVALAGVLLLCIGMLFTIPLASLAWAFFYHDVFDRERGRLTSSTARGH